jgi:hypothetical protein
VDERSFGVLLAFLQFQLGQALDPVAGGVLDDFLEVDGVLVMLVMRP